ncbi:tetrapyrrole biosynthesis, uroporphyrinogen III synthase [Lasiosphaeria miniovina]|uniref:Tetrapyrrole biosynthesis, uroporphyrinogen III synthase n=1 Tax=Lasiosphaeria miniovina TaxID=1954250 RepID=A0AA40ADV0_9PEZI|nr:tetrapyrrole biosynthesis, uroporphyrinogen III synthase [Lasiosphaeria miniovina]KAK0713833.1 tetrapyrrole biosynthesis, uroporphyrinogen III synthase [Lasiosphaeria miniovina]
MSQMTPILFLKTRSTPGDAYEELFVTEADGFTFEPTFVPVLEHRFDDVGMARVRTLLQTKSIGTNPSCDYGGLIFTSQRAVDVLAKLVQDERSCDGGWPHLQDVPVYSVGPATTRALRAVTQGPPLQIFGEHTGNGESLAHFILGHYGDWYKGRPSLPPLLFLVGEQRRDIIPRVLSGAELHPMKKIRVEEVVVYGTGEMPAFRDEFEQLLRKTANRSARWVVVFSPSGCDSVLGALDMLDEASGKAKPKPPGRNTFIATIGPTTCDYLKRKFHFDADVCSEHPSPEGVWQSITHFSKPLLR